METMLNLEQLGVRLASVDTMIMVLAKRRMELALQVGHYKRRENEKIFRADVEDKRIAKIKEWALEHGLNPNFAASFLYLLIDESCKQQMIQLQEESLSVIEPKNENEWYEGLKRNLLTLTERWCDSYDSDYEKHAFATKEYLDFERILIKCEIERLLNRGLAIDLGCATGRMTLPLSEHFERSVGYDISQHMVVTARRNAELHAFGVRNSFEQIDIEDGIPLGDATVSFVVMNLGTASDVRNIRGVIRETLRVLRPGGRFLFSFYNRDALLYRWEFLPWPVGLVASINLHKHCLEVHSRNEMLSVYARPYTVTEVETLFREVEVAVNLSTYPTMGAILPNDLFEGQPDIQEAVTALDRNLSTSSMGAYIIATGQK